MAEAAGVENRGSNGVDAVPTKISVETMVKVVVKLM